MPFVNELISDADKSRYDWNRLKWHARSYPHRPWKWTIDRDRNTFLVMLVGRGREGDHPEMYALWWNGEIIQFSAEIHSQGTLSTGIDLRWNVFDMEMKTSLLDQKDAIQKLLREAVDAFGNVYDRTGVKSVSVVFLPRLDRVILDDSRPGAVKELTYVERRYMRYDKPRRLDNYEFPMPRRVFLPIVGGITMIALFIFWIYMYSRGSINTDAWIIGSSTRRSGIVILMVWGMMVSSLIGGIAAIKTGLQNWKANRSYDVD